MQRGPASFSRRVRAGAAWRPEWPLGVAAVLAWAALLLPAGSTYATASSSTPVAARPFVCPIGSSIASVPAGELPAMQTSVAGVGVMTVAMMTPGTLPAARFVAFNSYRRRRVRAMAFYAAAYLSVFVTFGVGVILSAAALVPAGWTTPALAIALAVAGAWQLSAWKRRAATVCRRTVPLPPRGRRADGACIRFGLVEGSRCLRSTWPLMVVVGLAGHAHLPVMAAVTVIMLLEERPRFARRLLRPLGVMLLTVATLVAVSS